MDDQMFTKISNHIAFLLSTKNKLLMFSFTTTLAMFGAALTLEDSCDNIYIYALPFFILLPFAARITYYRIWGCHQNAFLKVFASEKYVLNYNQEDVPIERNFLDHIIGFLVNIEMALLSTGCLIIYFVKCAQYYTPTIKCYIVFLIPIISTILIYLFCISAYRYSKMSSKYINKWEEKGLYYKIIHKK